ERVPDHFDVDALDTWHAQQARADVVLDHVHRRAAHRGIRDAQAGRASSRVVVDRDDQPHVDGRHRDLGVLDILERAREACFNRSDVHAAAELQPRWSAATYSLFIGPRAFQRWRTSSQPICPSSYRQRLFAASKRDGNGTSRTYWPEAPSTWAGTRRPTSSQNGTTFGIQTWRQ